MKSMFLMEFTIREDDKKQNNYVCTFNTIFIKKWMIHFPKKKIQKWKGHPCILSQGLLLAPHLCLT